MLIDVVLYGGEYELLKARLDYLEADYTIIVEGDRHFRGQEKGWTLQQHLADLSRFNVIYMPIRSTQQPNPWQNEYHQRNVAMRKLHELGLNDLDIVGWFDVDEFPDAELICDYPQWTAWKMRKHQLSLYWYQQVELTGISASWAYVRDSDMANMRRQRGNLRSVDAGYHLSSMGTLDETLSKWMGFSHFELEKPNMEYWVRGCWEDGRAIENGHELHELTSLPDDMPDYFHKKLGPEHWYRKRDAA
jgi:hypothetical protein